MEFVILENDLNVTFYVGTHLIALHKKWNFRFFSLVFEA